MEENLSMDEDENGIPDVNGIVEVNITVADDTDTPRTPKRRPNSGKVVPSRTRVQIVAFSENLATTNTENGIKLSKNDIAKRVSQVFGVSTRTYYTIMAQAKTAMEKGEALETPGKTRNRPAHVRDTLDGFMQDALRRHIHTLYTQHVHPTSDDLLSYAQNDLGFKGKRTTFTSAIKKMGFKYKKFNGHPLLMEKHEVKLLRFAFLKKWKRFKEEGRFFVYVDEMWVWQNNASSQLCPSDDVYPQKTSSKGKRIVVLHAGGVNGFIPNCLLAFVSNTGLADHRRDMTSETFQEWFTDKLLKNIPPNSVIMLDNASYHSMVKDRVPASSSCKADMLTWLERNGIHIADQTMLKVQIYEMIRQHKPSMKRYIIDDLAKAAGHDVLRLPPFHCQFSAIEHMWGILKPQIAKTNKNFQAVELLQLAKECISEVTTDMWSSCIQDSEAACEEYYTRDPLIETYVEEMITRLGGVAEDTSEDDDL